MSLEHYFYKETTKPMDSALIDDFVNHIRNSKNAAVPQFAEPASQPPVVFGRVTQVQRAQTNEHTTVVAVGAQGELTLTVPTSGEYVYLQREGRSGAIPIKRSVLPQSGGEFKPSELGDIALRLGRALRLTHDVPQASRV